MNSVGNYYKKTSYQIVYGYYGYVKPKYGVFKLDNFIKVFDSKKEAIQYILNIT